MTARLCILVCALAVGCGAGASDAAFSAMYPDNQPAPIEEVARRLEAAGPRQASSLAVGLEDGALYAYDLGSGQEAWRVPVSEPRTAPWIAGALVITHEGDRVVGRRLSDGQRAFDMHDDRLGLVGADGDGRFGAFVLSTTGGVGAVSRVYLLDGTGVSTHYELESPVGVPAVAAGMVFVPWGNQNITVIEAATGAEIARVRSLAGVVSHALARGGHLYFGQSGVGRMSAQIGGGSPAEVGWNQPETGELPGAPPLWRSAYDPPQSAESATHRIRLEWSPTGADGPVAWADDTLYLTFYSMVFGLAGEDLSVRWVQQLQHDVVGAAATDGGVLLADDAGGLTFLAARDGAVRWTGTTSRAPSVVALRLGGFQPSGSGEPAAPLAEQLLAAVQSTDARLVPARAFAVRALAGQADGAVTDHLLVLCDDRSLPDPLRQASCESLATRELGSDVVLRALRRHAAYLEDTSAPPVGALASAAARMNERAAVPLLVAHLNDPSTAAQDIAPLADALGALGDHSAVRPLQDFLWLYHADVPDELFARSLAAVARAIVTLSGPPGRELVQEVMDAAFTPGQLRGQLRDVLEALAAQDEAAQDEAQDEAGESDE